MEERERKTEREKETEKDYTRERRYEKNNQPNSQFPKKVKIKETKQNKNPNKMSGKRKKKTPFQLPSVVMNRDTDALKVTKLCRGFGAEVMCARAVRRA